MISAILLAAGQSERMNGENKLTKKIQDIPLIKHSVKNILSSSIDELIVVLGYQKEIIEKLIGKNEKVKFIFNKNFESGMASSIKTGLNHLSEKTDAFFICLGDMPMVNKNIYNLLIKSKNFSINNIDINIIVQKPKIKKYSNKMIDTISKLCEINPNQINIKGKTTEKLGLIGKEKAIASEVIASVTNND